MISYDYKAIHIHIPRTAGSSIEQTLFKQELKSQNLWFGFSDYPIRNKYQMDGLQHLHLEQIKKEINSDIFNNFFKFTFIRNPYDKAISEYKYTKKEKLAGIIEYLGLNREKGFNFLKYLQAVKKSIKNKKFHPHFDLQKNFIVIDNRIVVDFIGMYEHLNVDWKIICYYLKNEIIDLPIINASTRSKNIKRYYKDNPGCQELVEEIYYDDFNYLNYKMKL